MTNNLINNRELFCLMNKVQLLNADIAKRSVQTPNTLDKNFVNQTVVGYTPKNLGKCASLVKTPKNNKALLLSDLELCILPKNSIIEMVEFFGLNFQTKGVFNIGIGQLNDQIILPLVENTKSVIANERHGGCRYFYPVSQDGSNSRPVTLYDSPINVSVDNPSTGYLQVVIYFHTKPQQEES